MTTTTTPAPIASSHNGPIERVAVEEYRGHVIEVYRTVAPFEWTETRWAGPGLPTVKVEHSEVLWFTRICWADREPRTYVESVKAKALAGDVAKITKRLRADVDAVEHDEEIHDELARILAVSEVAEGVAPSSTPAVGDHVAVFSRGQYRPGRVDKVTRTGRVTVAYVTRGGLEEAAKYRGPEAHATITRKADTVENLRLLMQPSSVRRATAAPVGHLLEPEAVEDAREAAAEADQDLADLELSAEADDAGEVVHQQKLPGRNLCGAEWSAAGWTVRPDRVTCPDCRWAAMQSPALDDLLRAEAAAEATDHDDDAFAAARDAYRAMQAAAPPGWSAPRRARELGIPRSTP